MTVTYKITDIGIKVPILHKVVYDYVEHTVLRYTYSEKNAQIDEWLKQNCSHSYYHSPGYLQEKFIQFECDHEALLFALKWT